MNIYIACGLTHVPRDEFHSYVDLIERVAARLEDSRGARVKYALRDSDPQLADMPFSDRARLCYAWDREMVEWADFVVAEASYPSTGLGIELQIACAKGIPVLLVFKRDEKHKARPIDYKTPDNVTHSLQLGEGYVSLMALGLPNVLRVMPYESSEQAQDSIEKAVDELHNPTVAGEA